MAVSRIRAAELDGFDEALGFEDFEGFFYLGQFCHCAGVQHPDKVETGRGSLQSKGKLAR